MTHHNDYIPLSKPHIPAKVYENLKKVLESGKLSGDGTFCHTVEKKLCDIMKVKHTLLTTSCTHALEMSMMLLNASPGDEVILPSFTFTSTANAVILAGLKPVFCDINHETMNMNMDDVARKITKKTRAIIPVHYAGVACNMDILKTLCEGKNITIVEDAAQGVGSKWKDKALGTIGHLGALSFHDTKNVMCGEGGALLTNDDAFCERAQIIREKGTNRSQFIKGVVDKYTWVDKGSSYILAEPLAAILDAEVDIIQELNDKRGSIYNFYMKELQPLADKGVLTLPSISQYCTPNYHLFHIILRDEEKRNSLMAHLRGKNIGATFHYIPLHTAPAGEKLGNKKGDLPVTEEYALRLLRLPLYPDLTIEQCFRVVNEINAWNED